ncbi:conserved hypothetical protein [Chthoniobacter flavus Ellin428]|uniref:von Hippel-Lindau disease tumour suppressor beta domain-containing protein n=1 Tax=Chthoniobacter flavus Ellin428 TaxID=497964 RepID=B4D7F6_9BACT|nr:hypothetical protein [Chthoniobacter flavus]EDY17573.1 conserved hypothetical protein [Chthoniobacter flavus Ellin428]TCO92396.1 von Hippel-Lindau disease tumor suppressor protein [Chthoniobacter flavus]
MNTAVTPGKFAALAVSAFWMIVAPAALAQRLHPAEMAGIKSAIGAATKITFVNGSTQAIQVYWIDYNGNRVLYQTLAPGEEYGLNTYLHHPWVITDEEGNAWTIYYADAQPRRVIVTKPEPD